MGRRPVLLGAVALLVLATATGAVAFLRADAPTTLGTSLGSPAPSASASDGHCAVQLEPHDPAFAPPLPRPAPTSTLVVSAELPTPWLRKAIGAHVPVRLASSAGQSIGAAGKVSYEVTRGDFSFDIAGDHLWVRLPVAVQAEVCKPLAGFCPVYGSCAPSLGVGVGVPLMLDVSDPSARTSLSIQQGCSIAGLDVTDRIESQAAGQLASVKARVDGAIPTAERRAAGLAIALAPRPIPGESQCLRLSVKRVVQAPARLADSLSLRLAAHGTLELGSCAAEPVASPRIERGEVEEGASDLAVAAEWPWQDVLAAFAPSFGDDAVRLTHVRGARIEGALSVVMKLYLDGRVCGPVWVTARPVLRDGALALEGPALADGSRLPGDAHRALVERLEALRAPLPKSARTMVAELGRIEAMVAAATAKLPPEVDLEVHVTGDPPALRVSVSEGGLQVVARRVFTSVVAPRAKPGEPAP